jgi:hypothetical protein
MEITVTPYTDISIMWCKVLNASRVTVNKGDTGKEPSDKFKKSILRSKHSPIRKLKFEVVMKNVPAHVTQQFSRHHIAIESCPGVMFSEEINPTDVEHFVRTSREDRTGIPRGERKQNDLIDYSFDINCMGLFTASEKRLCFAADKDAVKAWGMVKDGVNQIDPNIAIRMVRNCVAIGFCPEDKSLVKCNYSETEAFEKERKAYEATT